MDRIFYNPWVGKKYEDGIGGKKILVLGESHHCTDACHNCGITTISHNCNSFTTTIILKYLKYKENRQSFERWMNTFTRFANISLGKKLNKHEQIDFWESVSFYNYVQKAVFEARLSPTRNDFNNSLNAFHDLIENLKPDLIILWGHRLWHNLPKEQYFTSDENTLNLKISYYKKDNLKIPIKIIHHPSSSTFSYSHSKEIKEFINGI